jgi:hypothetical protein
MSEWPADSTFPGITKRPYDQARLADVDWRGINPIEVWFRGLWLTQDKLTIAAMLSLDSFSTDPYPRAVLVDGRAFLEDGHHRVIREALSNARSMSMRVFVLPFEHSR